MQENFSVPIFDDDGSQIFKVFWDNDGNPIIDLKQSRSKNHQTLGVDSFNEQLMRGKMQHNIA